MHGFQIVQNPKMKVYFIFKIVFIYAFKRGREGRVGEGEREGPSAGLVYSPNVYKCQDWAGMKPGARNSTQEPETQQAERTGLLELPAGNWSQELVPDTEPRLSVWEASLSR